MQLMQLNANSAIQCNSRNLSERTHVPRHPCSGSPNGQACGNFGVKVG